MRARSTISKTLAISSKSSQVTSAYDYISTRNRDSRRSQFHIHFARLVNFRRAVHVTSALDRTLTELSSLLRIHGAVHLRRCTIRIGSRPNV